MDVKKFILPEMKTPFDVERANRDTQSQLRTLSLTASFLSIFFLLMFYLIFSLQTFLIWLGISIVGNYVLWRFHKRVENTERGRAESKTFLPAEELVLDHDGYHWMQRGLQPIRMEIPWENVKQIAFDPLDSFILNGQNQKTKFPRIMFENQNEIMEFIEQNLDLKKTTEDKHWRDEDYTAVFFTR
jgi:hypothetical protein